MTKKEEVNIDYWDTGNKKVETYYKNGKLDGLTTGWYESGEKEQENQFSRRKGNEFSEVTI
jgi:antitoxin component YwqK of YwqJK toxin-antitoxin module